MCYATCRYIGKSAQEKGTLTTKSSCDACEGALPDKPYKTPAGIACSPSCSGFLLVRKAIEEHKADKEAKSRPLKRGFVQMDPEPTPFVLPKGMKTKPTKVPGMGRVEVIRNIYHVDEITILMRVHKDSSVQMLGQMQNVYAYTDPKLGLLLRPNSGGVRETLDDFPKAIRVAKKSVYKRKHKDDKSEEQATTSVSTRPLERKVIAEASFGNLQEDPTSKRFWLIESMTRGGTAKEIVRRAATLAVGAGYFGTEDEYLEKFPSNYMAIKKMFDWWKVKLNQARIQHRIVEVDENFNVEIVRR